MGKLKIGIVGGAGYTGGELIRLLINHPHAEISFIHSKSNSGNLVSHVHGDLAGETDLAFTADLDDNIDVMFYAWDTAKQKSFSTKTRLQAT